MRKCKQKFNSDTQKYYTSCKEQTMRNKIVVNEPDQKRYITQFVPGEMFTYAGSDKSDNVYMKLAHSEVDEAVLLTTGARFPINREALLSPVSSITISKNK